MSGLDIWPYVEPQGWSNRVGHVYAACRLGDSLDEKYPTEERIQAQKNRLNQYCVMI